MALVVVLSWQDGTSTASKQSAPRTDGLVATLPDATAPMVFSPDGKLLATTGGGAVSLWDTATGTLVRELPEPTRSDTAYLAFRQDGRFLIAGTPASACGCGRSRPGR